ncbi:MAG: Rpn family recombination-promoting nuclease/putative transposase [Clostridiales bacterium]|nr:Rpn family recombination-promoting nuclease/putative transposase [Clostridiales bacterium]
MSTVLLKPLNDLVFKALFGRDEANSKIILIDLLNELLKLKGKDRIEEVVYLNPFTLKEYSDDKGSIMDLKVKTETGERINVEVQLNNVDDFRKRSLYYWAKMYAETINEGESYINLRKSIVINLLDFNLIDETENYHTIYRIIEKDEGFKLTDDLEIHYIELKKFEKQMEKEKDCRELEGIELWLSFIKNTGEEGSYTLIDTLTERSEKIKMAKEMLEKISANELMRQKYYAKEKARLDEISRIKFAEQKGMERGMERGMQQGMERGMERGMQQGMERGMERGIKQGIAKGKTDILIRQYTKRFGTLPEELQVKIQNASAKELDFLAENIFDIDNIDEIYDLMQ